MLRVEWQSSRIYCCFRSVFEAGGMREGEPRERYFRRRGNFHRFPRVSTIFRRFRDELPFRYSRQATYRAQPRSGWHEISSMEINFSFDRCNGARARMPTLGTEHFRSHASITEWRHSINMMIYWRRMRLIHRRRGWFLADLLDISPDICQLSLLNWKSISPIRKITSNIYN